MSDQGNSTKPAEPVESKQADRAADEAYAAAAAALPVKTAPAKPAAAAVAKVEAEPVKAAPAPVAKKAPAKPVAAKAQPSKAAPKKTPAKAAKPAPKTIKKSIKTKPVAAKPAPIKTKKDSIIMTTTEKLTTETKKAADAMTDRMKGLMGDMTTRAKTAFEKGSEMVSQASEFNKGNVEALVESGKIAAKGAQEMTKVYAEDTRKNFEAMTAAMKDFTAVKSPTEFLQLQSEMVRKSFDNMVAQSSKNSEAFLKLAGDVFQPISNRVSVAVESFKKAA